MRHFVGTPSGETMHYTLKDHQGSLMATVHGSTVERLCYDPWGRRRNTTDFGYDNVSHTFDSDYHDIYSYVERAYEPRDLGILQLSTDDPTVVWMEENEMHGGGKEGGFYVNLASGLIEHHNGQTNFEYLKQGLLFLAEEKASIGDIENALEQKGLSYQRDPNVIGGYLIDTEEMFKGYLLWQSIPSMTTVFALGSVECLFNSISLLLSSIKSIEKTTSISYEFTNTTFNWMDDPARRVPLNIIDEVIKNPQIVGPDPQGTTANMYYSTIYKNGKLYNIEVLYKQSNNTIYHFLYSPSPLGPMPPIKP